MQGNGTIRLRIEADYYCQRNNGPWTDLYYYITAEVRLRWKQSGWCCT